MLVTGLSCALLLVSFANHHFSEAAKITKRDDGQLLTVVTIEESPYVQLKDPSGEGNGNFIGFIPELMEEISDLAKLNYRFELVADHVYGSKNPSTGTWNGMVGDLMKHKADIAAAPMTISDERKQVIDFTKPFMDVGLSLVYMKPTQGEERPFNTMKDLTQQNQVTYGLVRDGMTEAFFKNSRNSTIRDMWNKISTSPNSGKLASNEVGIDKVRQSQGSYAFIMESNTADYYINKSPCDLGSLPIEKKTSEYGLGVTKSSKHLNAINDAIQSLRNDGTIKKLKNKWWKGDCTPQDDVNAALPVYKISSSFFFFFTLCFYQKVVL